jgi:phage tail sheath gpL-like
MITFSEIGSGIRKPGIYGEFNLSAARQALPTNNQEVLFIAQKTSAGSATALVPVMVTSESEAKSMFGAGSQAHLMVKAAFAAYRNCKISVLPLDDAGSSVAATGSLVVSGTATSAGVCILKIGAIQISVAVASGDAALTVANAIRAAAAKIDYLPVALSGDTATITITAKNKGTIGNRIPVACAVSSTGITGTVTAMANGATDPTIGGAGNALDKVFNGSFNIYCTPYIDSTSLGSIKTHVTEISGAIEHRPAIAVFGYVDRGASPTTSTVKTLCGTTLNHWRMSCAYIQHSVSLDLEIGAAYAAVLASVTDPALPLNNEILGGIAAPSASETLNRLTIEDLLSNGVTPLTVIPGGYVAIVRAITTYTQNASGIPDPNRLDISTPRTLDYVRSACVQRISNSYPRAKKTAAVKKAIRLDLLDVLIQCEKLELVEGVADLIDYLVVEDDLQDPTRVNARIPAPIVRGLHVLAERIDLL